jgi:hypothetical protein
MRVMKSSSTPVEWAIQPALCSQYHPRERVGATLQATAFINRDVEWLTHPLTRVVRTITATNRGSRPESLLPEK